MLADTHPPPQDSSRLTALLQSSLAASGTDVSRDICDEGGWVDEEDGGDEAGNYLRVPVVGGDDRPLLEYFSVECHPERVRDWRSSEQVGFKWMDARRWVMMLA